jgi:hypothetical protein
MLPKQSYDIGASFLVPVYNLSKDIDTIFITTQKGTTPNGSIRIDVWLVNALPEQPFQSMIQSLKNEEEKYQRQLGILEKEEKSQENDSKIYKLQNAQKLFSQLIREAKDPAFRKQPDAAFLDIAKRNLLGDATFNALRPDLKNFLYLAGLTRYEEVK